jgi:nicotinate-nucleotide adenylyltransferase
VSGVLLFGGAFDPIHNGHLYIAEAARTVLGLERVVFLPTRTPRHRGGLIAAPDERAAMVRLAIASNPAFALDTTDLLADSTGYTADLLPRLRARYPSEEFNFLVGGDSLVDSPWQRFGEVLIALERFVVAPRGDDAMRRFHQRIAGFAPELRTKIVVLDLPLVPVSATVVRGEFAAGRSARYLVPEPVWRHIVEHRLYRAAVAHA